MHERTIDKSSCDTFNLIDLEFDLTSLELKIVFYNCVVKRL